MDDSLIGSELALRGEGRSAPVAFPTVPGRVYELRAALRRCDGNGSLSLSTMRLDFFDARGCAVDPRIVGPELQVPHLDPLHIETLPDGEEGEIAFDAGLASRFVVAPPDAVAAQLVLETPETKILHLELTPLAINWPTEGRKVQAELDRALAARQRLLARLSPNPDGNAEHAEALALVRDVPLAQIGAIATHFAGMGDWGSTLGLCSAREETAAGGKRIERLRADEAARLTVGFIGSARSYHRLSAYADVVLLREDAWEGQLAAFRFDMLLIESVPESMTGDWALAFCSLPGGIPAKGKTLLAAAEARGLAVRFHVTAEEREFGVWRELAETADAVVIEGDPARWTDPPPGAAFIRRATEPAIHPPLRQGTAENLMLVPVASDIFQYPDFAALLNEGSCYDLLLTEFDYGFAEKALADRLSRLKQYRARPLRSQAQRTRLLQESTIVLLSALSLRSPEQLLDITLDAIACGAIPVLFGAGDAKTDLGTDLDRVWGAAELIELQHLYRIPWLRERRWRLLWRAVCRHHVWNSRDRAALLGTDPCVPDLDRPLVSTIMVSKRPHRLAACLETFRKQSCPEKELLLVLNTDAQPADLPALHENERLFVLPESWNIGRCLNIAVAEARGRYWAKMDDDDYYSRHYLEELRAFFRASQVDAVGRQAIYFYFAGLGESLARQELHARTFRHAQPGTFVAGATLSARKATQAPAFSNRLRNCVDSEWVKALHQSDLRLASFDSTSMIVHRDADDAAHTWMLPAAWNISSDARKHFNKICIRNAHDLFESHLVRFLD